MNETLILKNSNKKKLALLIEKAKEMGLEISVKPKEIKQELTQEQEREGFLFTTKVNASKMFGKHL